MMQSINFERNLIHTFFLFFAQFSVFGANRVACWSPEIVLMPIVPVVERVTWRWWPNPCTRVK